MSRQGCVSSSSQRRTGDSHAEEAMWHRRQRRPGSKQWPEFKSAKGEEKYDAAHGSHNSFWVKGIGHAPYIPEPHRQWIRVDPRLRPEYTHFSMMERTKAQPYAEKWLWDCECIGLEVPEAKKGGLMGGGGGKGCCAFEGAGAWAWSVRRVWDHLLVEVGILDIF